MKEFKCDLLSFYVGFAWAFAFIVMSEHKPEWPDVAWLTILPVIIILYRIKKIRREVPIKGGFLPIERVT